MSRKLKAAEKRAKRQSRTTDKPKIGTERLKDVQVRSDLLIKQRTGPA
jgi:hypothetical protein